MAFQNVNQSASKEGVKLTGLKEGEVVIGYVAGFRESTHTEGVQNILMREEEGDGTFYVYTAGNVKYLVKDGKIKQGLLTRITRIADKMVNGKKSSQFTVEQDASRTIETAAESASFASITSASEIRKQEQEERNANVTNAITKQAGKLAASMAKRG